MPLGNDTGQPCNMLPSQEHTSPTGATAAAPLAAATPSAIAPSAAGATGAAAVLTWCQDERHVGQQAHHEAAQCCCQAGGGNKGLRRLCL